MLYVPGHYTKPPPGAEIDWGHPLARGLVGCLLFNEGSGIGVNNLVDGRNASIGNTPGATWRGQGVHIPDLADDYIALPTARWNPNVGTFTLAIVPSSFTVNNYYWDSLGSRFLLFLSSATQVGLYTGGSSRGAWTHGWSAGQRQILSLTWPANTLYVNGRFANDFSDGALGAIGATLYIGQRFDFTNRGADTIYEYCADHDRALLPDEIRWLHAEPYAMIQAPVWRRYFISGLVITEAVGQDLVLEHGETDLFGYSEAVGTDLLLEHGETDLYGYWEAVGIDLLLEHGETDTFGYWEAVGADLIVDHGAVELYGYWEALGVDLVLEHGETDSHYQKNLKSYYLAGGTKSYADGGASTYALAGGEKTYDP